VAFAVVIRFLPRKPIKATLAYLLVGAWALIPPIWFMFEWHEYTGGKEGFEFFKYGQELARNVWIALVVVLATIAGIKWKDS
jgi:hypothetical protein